MANTFTNNTNSQANSTNYFNNYMNISLRRYTHIKYQIALHILGKYALFVMKKLMQMSATEC